MAEDKSYIIDRTLEGETIYYFARNNEGVIFAKELTLEKLQAAIKIYKEPPPIEEEEKKFLTNKLSEQVQEREKEQEAPQTATSDIPPAEGDSKQFLENDLKTKVQERKQQSKKKSFWDKLK